MILPLTVFFLFFRYVALSFTLFLSLSFAVFSLSFSLKNKKFRGFIFIFEE